ncbi:hypothetical protein C7M84_023982 [Penaeus vannamei]|uniref:Uncharacterized protein n=1 Tax=Penaeus vannamei TaxID=6689 RepID=A0A423U2C2_PENVA|nr:hypothetical protein C7M84_023982 [Penaeus vannamei]
MACTFLRIVQAAVSLRRRFECAIQSSFESVESGEGLDRHGDQEGTEENGQSQPCEQDMSTSEQLSRNFQLSFTDADEDTDITLGYKAKKEDTMTFIRSDEATDEKENGAYMDAVASSSIEILEENEFDSDLTESGKTEEFTENGDSRVSAGTIRKVDDVAVQKKTVVQVNEISGSDKSSDSDSSSESRCSIKSVRLRSAEAVSPSSGCKPAKLIRSDALETNAEKEASNLHQKTEYLGYSEWLQKGQGEGSAEAGSTSGSSEASPEQVSDVSDPDSESFLDDDDEFMVEASFEDSFVDDGFVSLELDEYDDDVIIEENEEDLERERLEELMLEQRRRFFAEGPGRGEPSEHRKLSRQYSPAVYLTEPLPGL